MSKNGVVGAPVEVWLRDVSTTGVGLLFTGIRKLPDTALLHFPGGSRRGDHQADIYMVGACLRDRNQGNQWRTLGVKVLHVLAAGATPEMGDMLPSVVAMDAVDMPGARTHVTRMPVAHAHAASSQPAMPKQPLVYTDAI